MIRIIYSKLLQQEKPLWYCLLEMEHESTIRPLPASAPGELLEGELQAHFENNEPLLWELANSLQYSNNIFAWIPMEDLLTAFALLVINEINILRDLHNLPQRTPQQLEEAIKGLL